MVFGGSGKFHVTGGVQRSLNGVLNNANDEANADDLHGNIIGNAKQRAGHGDEQQRTACTPEAPHAPKADMMDSRMAAGTETCMPRVLAAASVMMVMVMAARSILMVAPSGMEAE